MDELHQRAIALLEVIWRGIPNSYKSRYRRSIWQQFEDNVRSAAYTANLGKFINALCLALGANIGRNVDDREIANDALGEGNDKAMLKLMRNETTFLVLSVRVRNQERYEEWETSQLDMEQQFEKKEVEE